jgi:hypothetical protein
LTAVFIAGLIFRLWLFGVSTRHGYTWDHFDNAGMGLAARKHGLFRVYKIGKEDLVAVPGQRYRDGEFEPIQRKAIILPNYPPIAMSMFWLQTGMLPKPICLNTFSARLIMGSFALLAEMATAVVVAMIGWDLLGRRRALLAACACWLFPPIAMNAGLWGQIDSLVLAPAALTVWFLLRQRWVAAGLTVAIACLAKPQGVLLGPIALFAAIVLPSADVKSRLRRVLPRLVKMGAAFITAIVLLTLPWTISSGPAWVDRTYVQSFFEAFPHTTLHAYNFWYLDLYVLDGKLVGDAVDSSATIAGVTKDTWGRLLAVAAMICLAVACWRRYRGSPMGVVLYAALWLWSMFIWPTRVHERFIIYCIPFVLVAAAGMRRLWPAVVLLLIVGAAEHSWNVWSVGPGAGSFQPQRTYARYLAEYESAHAAEPSANRPPLASYSRFYQAARDVYLDSPGREETKSRELLVTILSLLGYLWAIAAALVARPPADISGAPRRSRPGLPTR